MDMIMSKSEHPQVLPATVTRSTQSVNSSTAENSFAMVLGEIIQPNQEPSQPSSNHTGTLNELLKQIEQLLAELFEQVDLNEKDIIQRLGEEEATTPLLMMMQSEDLENLVQVLSSFIGANNGTALLFEQSQLNSMPYFQQVVGNAFQVGSNEQQAIQASPFIAQAISTEQQSLQLKEVLEAIRMMLVAAKEGSVTLKDGDLGKLASLLKHMATESQSMNQFVRVSAFEQSKALHFRSFDMTPTLQRVTWNTNEGTALGQQSSLANHEQSNSPSNFSSSSPTKIGFHQLFAGSIQPPETINVQVAEKESIVRAQHVQKDLNDFMVRQLQMTRFPNGVSEAKIRLFPHNLGSVEVRLSVQQGILTAQFITETRAGKELIDSQLASLRSSLIASGLQVEKIEVNMPNNANHSNGQAQDSLNRQGSGQKEQQFAEDNYHEEDLEEDFSTVFEQLSEAI